MQASSLRGVTAAVLLGTLATAAAQPQADGRRTHLPDRDPSPGFSARFGAGVGLGPEYRGSDEYEATPLPLIDVRLGRFYASTLDGLGWNVIDGERFQLGPFLSYAEGRDDDGDLSEFEDVDGSAMAGFAGGWESGPWEVEADIAAPLGGDLEGVRGRASARYRGRLHPQWRYAVGPGITLGNGEWTEALFSVSAADAARSGLNADDADGVYFAAELGGRLTFQPAPAWSVSALGSVSRLFGDAADSPIVDDIGDADQAFVGVTFAYRFR